LEVRSIEIEELAVDEELERAHPICKSQCHSLLPIYIANYHTVPSVFQLEAAHPIVSVEELPESLLEALEIACFIREIEVSLSESLGISLEEVRAHYF
jgi:hypothetical protein